MPDLWLSEATMTSDASSRALSTLPRTTTTFLHSSTSNATSFPILAATTRLHVQHGHALLSDFSGSPFGCRHTSSQDSTSSSHDSFPTRCLLDPLSRIQTSPSSTDSSPTASVRSVSLRPQPP
ncbi:hypothetical protein PC120_g23205 [Phytophthora cactorum]|nr:hypothetical protein PC120_g23205 [Phytophthora cactorum]